MTVSVSWRVPDSLSVSTPEQKSSFRTIVYPSTVRVRYIKALGGFIHAVQGTKLLQRAYWVAI